MPAHRSTVSSLQKQNYAFAATAALKLERTVEKSSESRRTTTYQLSPTDCQFYQLFVVFLIDHRSTTGLLRSIDRRNCAFCIHEKSDGECIWHSGKSWLGAALLSAAIIHGPLILLGRVHHLYRYDEYQASSTLNSAPQLQNISISRPLD